MNAEAFLDVFRAVELLIIIIMTIRLIVSGKNSTRLVFFSLALACVMLSDLYWLVFDILYPDFRMPFAANEFGENAMFLLLGASLTRGHKIRFSDAVIETIASVVFSAWCAGLWIAWTGEWFQDIFTGVVIAYFLCALAVEIKREKAMTLSEGRLMAIGCLIVLVGQTGTFLVADEAKRVVDLFCYAMMFLISAALIYKSVFSIIRKTEPKQGVCHAFMAFIWVITTMYMSDGVFHTVALALSAVCFFLMFIELKMEAAKG